ncbi:DUF1772 domain-containing protein [Cupriavidus necator]|uniref:Uncharacterized protein n=1 Tax=Cupriavidus necator (strain ATCC 17699 / DSM 428 / KCTC 22496 / NCIMB 10442 / H16 / Stanier 337) TaxID=381666 RepID=A0AAE5ZF59_CUPNH|nr:hypothetical protein [Cupriavidus necator]QCC01188.1 hypothetical protein E6A55_11750 [Cupriavidus necator H16]QQB75984.1 hypothetical protein I6H87_14395 [Cupriavidus necator]WKA39573.1 hypothetical protein QWP09_11765 [Cupriavidus necator]
MRKTWNWKFAIKAVGSGILGLVAMLMLVEIRGAWTGPENYPFGGQGPSAAMWAYQSQANYLLSCFALLLGYSLAIWALLAMNRSIWLRWLAGMPVLLLWAWMALDGSRLDL